MVVQPFGNMYSLLKQTPSTIRFFATLQRVDHITWNECCDVVVRGLDKGENKGKTNKETLELVVAQVYSDETNLTPMQQVME